MRFKDALFDGSDPLYAPCCRLVKRWFYWRPPQKYVQMGYNSAAIRLPGELNDGQDMARAARARELTAEMARHFERTEPQITHGTWGWLIQRYLHDEYSPFQDVKENTAKTYREMLVRLDAAIGQTMISAADLTAIKRWQKAMKDGHEARVTKANEIAEINWLRSLVSAGPKIRQTVFRPRPIDATDYVKRMFTTLRILVGYGVQIKAPGARDVREILSEIRIKSPRPRTQYPTESQMEAILRQADLAGNAAFSLGLLCQWWLALRAVDVRGQWLGTGKNTRWADGLTWDMIDKDLIWLRKIPSKTERSADTAFEFDLRMVPEIRARLEAIPTDQRIGPVIKQPNGQPFHQHRWTKLFRIYADQAGIPRDLRMMDTRAGAINHAKLAGASPADLQRQAGHATMEMTERYVRGHDEARNRVIEMRQRARTI